MSTSRRFDAEISQIESIAETKGIDIDDIEVNETTTDDGDELVVFRILETKGETEKESVGVQVSKMPSVQTGDMTFRNDVQNKLNALKRHLAGEQPSEQVDEEPDPSDTNDTDSSQTRSRSRDTGSTDGNGPGAEIDARIQAIEDDLDDLEARVAEIEDKAEALDGLKRLMDND